MKKMVGIAIGVVIVLVVAGVGYHQGWFARRASTTQLTPASGSERATGTQEASGQAPSDSGTPAAPEKVPQPQFDGNVAALQWGGNAESATGVTGDNRSDLNDLLNLIDNDPDTIWKSNEDPGPKNIVLSFYDHESVLIDHVIIAVSDDTQPDATPRDAEVWVSSTGPKEGFTRVGTSTLRGTGENTISFAPVEAKYVQVRLLRNFAESTTFAIQEIKVMEAHRNGYTSLMARRPDVSGPSPAQNTVPTTVAGAVPACVPEPSPAQPGHGESKHVLVLAPAPWNPEDAYAGVFLKNHSNIRHGRNEDLSINDRADFTVVAASRARPWMLGPKNGYDTVVLEQVCEGQPTPMRPDFKPVLAPWVAEGHKLIIHDADNCSPGPDYGWLPYLFKTNNPGAQGASGDFLRFTEENWMLHSHQGRPGYINLSAWENSDEEYRNELGDSNTLTGWDPHWCGQMVVRNVNNIFGFVSTYAHYGRGLIIYDGFDIDMKSTTGYDLVISRELAQGFDPDNLPCAARIGDFVVTTDTRLMERPVAPGRSYDYPLSLLSNQGYKGTISLSSSASPGVPGMQASFNPSSVNLDGLAEAKLSVTLPANAPSTPQALQVKGADAAGKTNTLCLQLVQPRTGELSVVSTLHPSKTGKNLEIILDASGSMKLPLGKKSRWTTAHDVLSQVLGTLPGDFNVGLRIYGHRESSRSPKTCTDSELVVPIQKLDQSAILSAAEAVKPRGETPLVYSVLQAPDDLKAVGGGTVIVITDGEESCKGDPQKAAAQLKASGVDITLNIVGFTITGQQAQKQLASFAQSTGGRFYAAQNGAALAQALQLAAVDRFPYTVYDGAGKQVAAGEAGGEPEQLPPGEYSVVVNAGTTNLTAQHVKVVLAQQTAVKIVFKNDQLGLEQ